MKNIMLWLYLADVSDGVSKYSCGLTIFSFFAVIVLVFVAMGLSDEDAGPAKWKEWRRWLFVWSSTFLVCLPISVLVPKEKTIYLMMGAKTAEEIAINPRVQETGGKIMDLINKKIDELTIKEVGKK